MKGSQYINKNYHKIILVLLGSIVLLMFLKVLKVDKILGDIEWDKLIELENENEEYKNLGTNPTVRVLIMTDNFKEEEHQQIELKGESLVVTDREGTVKLKDQVKISLTPHDIIFDEGSVVIENHTDEGGINISSIKRSYGSPSYMGSLEIYSTGEKLVIINELPLEEYLRFVVPSEMPSSFELEALKAQAVCARSYAYSHMQTITYDKYEAHMNDSVSYQVYNNIATNERTDRAIEETWGEKLGMDGKVITTYFFSTSSGNTTDVQAWGTQLSEKNQYLQGIHVGEGDKDYESHLPWYSWKIELPEKDMEKILLLNIDDEIGTLKNVAVKERGAGEVALELEITGSEKTISVTGENAIRKVLGSDQYQIIKNDGKSSTGTSLLPSAFFTIEKKGDTYYIEGGGLGHGIGMSQHGANEIAKLGKNYQDILNTFYQGVELIKE